MINAILQARLSSTRLPGKVLKSIEGKPMLQHQIERVRRSDTIDEIIIATSDEEADLPIKQLCERLDIRYYRGSLEDVLDRFYQAAKKYNSDYIVRLTADCPLIDPEVIDKVVEYYKENNYDYVSNTSPPTFPDGLDVEVFTFDALNVAWDRASLSSEREHVTPYIRKHDQKFSIGNFENDKDLSHLRWTVDRPEDLKFVRKIYRKLYHKNPKFNMEDILELIEREPHLKNINDSFERNEGFKKSLENDKKYER